MKNVRNFLAMVLALVMILSMAACGGTAPEETKAPTEATTEAATEEATEAPIPTETEDEQEQNEDIFTDSVTQKGEPAIKGKLVIWDMVDDDIDLDPKDLTEEEKDAVVCEVPAEKLTMVAFAKRADTEVQEALEAAYTEILGAETLADLDEDIKEAAEESEMDLEKLVVRDLLDITLAEEYDAVLNEEENYIALSFELNLAEGEKLIVMTRTVDEDGEVEWEVISGDEILYNADGTVTVAFEELCPVAFVVEGN